MKNSKNQLSDYEGALFHLRNLFAYSAPYFFMRLGISNGEAFTPTGKVLAIYLIVVSFIFIFINYYLSVKFRFNKIEVRMNYKYTLPSVAIIIIIFELFLIIPEQSLINLLIG